jgi:hypothetical protein
VDHILNLDTLIELMLGISLSAAAGFRVFVPLLILSLAAVVGHINIPTELTWAETPEALVVFAVACLLEIGGYYIPWVDHALDIVATPIAILVGTIMTGYAAPSLNPIVQWTLALVIGGGTAGLTKTLMNFLRGTSTAASGGVTNPIVSTIELVFAVSLTLLALSAPLVAGVVVIGVFIVVTTKGWGLLRSLWRDRKTVALSPAAPSSIVASDRPGSVAVEADRATPDAVTPSIPAPEPPAAEAADPAAAE